MDRIPLHKEMCSPAHQIIKHQFKEFSDQYPRIQCNPVEARESRISPVASPTVQIIITPMAPQHSIAITNTAPR